MDKKAKNKQYHQVFIDAYTKEYPCIISSRKGPTFAFCSICSADIKISHGGMADVKHHIKSKKHHDLLKCKESNSTIGNFFASSSLNTEEVINAECLFMAFILEHNLPLAVADHVGPLFKKMFPKSEIVKKYACGRTKTAAIIGKMASVKKNVLDGLLQKTVFALSTDGSNDSDSQLYPIVITYFNKEIGKIENSLLAVPALSGNSTGQNIGNLMLETLESRSIPIKNCIAFSADNANVMMGHKNGVAAVLKNVNNEIIMMGCLCHLVHLAAENGANTLPVSIDEILIDLFY